MAQSVIKGAALASSWVIDAGHLAPRNRAVPQETPVALVYNGSTHAVMMATPADLEDFGRGFTRSEGLGEVEELQVIRHEAGIEVQMWLPEVDAQALAQRRRAMAGPVGCGLCGIESLDQAVRNVPSVSADLRLRSADIEAAMLALPAAQPLQDETRAVHAAGLFQPGKGLVAIREDVGRHNALDKLIGAVGSCSTGALVITSRISVEMVQKAAWAGAPVLIAVSAPTELALRVAHEAQITLIALARGASFEIFTHPQRVQAKESIDVA